MGWASSFFRRLMMKSDSSSTSGTPPLFAVGTTEMLLSMDVPELTVRDLNKATRTFSAARIIGRCTRNHGTVVYKATLPNGAGAAAKVLGWPSSRAWGASEDLFLRQQVSLLSTLRHDNLVRLLGYANTPNLRVLLFEFATMGTLHDILHGPSGVPQPGSSNRPTPVTLSWAQRTQIALDMARGLRYLHETAAVSHWGIRSTNVLLFRGFRAKIADYDVFEQSGDMRVHSRRATSIDVGYLPPEYVIAGTMVPRKADVYSFGVVLLELLTGRKSFDVTLQHQTHLLVYWATPLVRKGRIEQLIDAKLGTRYPRAAALKLARIAQQCVHRQARYRPSMEVVTQMISDIVI